MVVKLQSVPGSQFKEILMPTKQVSGNWQLTDTVSVGAYYQFEWNKTRLPAAVVCLGRSGGNVAHPSDKNREKVFPTI